MHEYLINSWSCIQCKEMHLDCENTCINCDIPVAKERVIEVITQDDGIKTYSEFVRGNVVRQLHSIPGRKFN